MIDVIRRNKNYVKVLEFSREHPIVCDNERCFGNELLTNLSSNLTNFNSQIVSSDYYLDKRSEPLEWLPTVDWKKHHFIVFKFRVKRKPTNYPLSKTFMDVEMTDDDSNFISATDKRNHLQLFWEEMLRSARSRDFDLYD